MEDRYDVYLADDAKSAMELLEREHFDVLLTDFRLPTATSMDVRVGKEFAFNRVRLNLDFDIFNLFNRTNYVPPTGNRQSANFMIPTSAQFPRQMQFGIRLRF